MNGIQVRFMFAGCNPSTSTRWHFNLLETTMKTTICASLLLALSGVAMAGPTCTAAKATWMAEADFKKGLEAQGYQIKTFKVSKGQCYEIYGFDKGGQKVEIYFDPQTGAVVASR